MSVKVVVVGEGTLLPWFPLAMARNYLGLGGGAEGLAGRGRRVWLESVFVALRSARPGVYGTKGAGNCLFVKSAGSPLVARRSPRLSPPDALV